MVLWWCCGCVVAYEICPSLCRVSAPGKTTLPAKREVKGDEWSFLLELHTSEKCIALAVA